MFSNHDFKTIISARISDFTVQIPWLSGIQPLASTIRSSAHVSIHHPLPLGYGLNPLSYGPNIFLSRYPPPLPFILCPVLTLAGTVGVFQGGGEEAGQTGSVKDYLKEKGGYMPPEEGGGGVKT